MLEINISEETFNYIIETLTERLLGHRRRSELAQVRKTISATVELLELSSYWNSDDCND